MSSPDFSGDDYEFAMGSIKGLRTWDMDPKGRLRGVTHAVIWTPGENVAECFARTPCPEAKHADLFEYGMCNCALCQSYAASNPSLSGAATTGAKVPSKPAPCTVEGCDGSVHPSTHAFDSSCECGFWAYDELGFTSHGRVTGIIEGYGRTTIGTKGFRCEKARIVALCREDDDKVLTLSEWLQLKALYPDAEFYDDQDDMVTAHGQVLRTYPAVDADFWTEKVETRPRDPFTAAIYKYASALALPPSPPPSNPGGGQS